MAKNRKNLGKKFGQQQKQFNRQVEAFSRIDQNKGTLEDAQIVSDTMSCVFEQIFSDLIEDNE